MTHTAQQLQTMSDDYLGVAFYNKFGVNFDCYNEIMPLAFERKIGLAPNKDSWEAFTLADNWQVISNQFVDANPLRAIACLVLMME